MTEPSVDDLRRQLRELGYLTRGVERWFAGDPFRSRSFWSGLLTVAVKAATVVALFAAAPVVAVMLMRNGAASAGAVASLIAIYVGASFVATALLVTAVALLLRTRAAAGIENPRILNTAAAALSALIAVGIVIWWLGFPTPPDLLELVVGGALLLLLLVVSVTAFSAALLSFTILETHRIPLVRRAPRTRIIASVGTFLIAVIALTALSRSEKSVEEPHQIAVRPSSGSLALIAVDGLSADLFTARPELARQLPQVQRFTSSDTSAPPERWATIGTGTPPSLHGVRSVEGIRLLASPAVLQTTSRYDPVLRWAAPFLRLATREALPPTARSRDYVWEVLASRGIPSVAVNWWAEEESEGPLAAVPQDAVFAKAGRRGSDVTLALDIDATATALTVEAVASQRPRFVTVYLPGLDILLHRLDLDAGARVTASLQALERLPSTVERLRAAGYEVVLMGVPAAGESGIVGSTFPLQPNVRPADLAPTLFDFFGFPASSEMAGRSALPNSRQPRIASFGARSRQITGAGPTREYYENLKSLGYIR